MRLDLLELLGVGYLTDAICAAAGVQGRREALEIYVTDALRHIARQTGVTLNRYIDIIKPDRANARDDRPAEDICDSIMRGAGLKFRPSQKMDQER